MSSYEASARAEKATKIAAYLGSLGYSAEDALALDAEARTAACEAALVKPASPETWAQVVATLSKRSFAVPPDPFHGLP